MCIGQNKTTDLVNNFVKSLQLFVKTFFFGQTLIINFIREYIILILIL
jgi:hypothetical protein